MIAEARRSILAVAVLITAMCSSDALRRRYLENQLESVAMSAHPVIVIPGFGNTRLFDPVANRFVWGTPRSMMRRDYADDLDLPIDPDTFTIGRDRLVPRGFVGSRGFINTGYQLKRALENYGGYGEVSGVFPFEYDWRKSAIDSAQDLRRLVEAIRNERGDSVLKIDLVTHSAGALVALAFIHENPETVRRAVLVAPPLDGTLEAFRVLARGERLIRRDINPKTAATFPFLFELLPSEPFLVNELGESIDVDWSQFRPEDESIAKAFERSLAEGRKVQDRLRRPLPKGVAVHVIAGDCIATARRAMLRRDGSLAFYPEELRADETVLRNAMFEPGDGSISVSSALASSAPYELFCDGHHGIASDPNVHRALIRALTAK